MTQLLSNTLSMQTALAIAVLVVIGTTCVGLLGAGFARLSPAARRDIIRVIEVICRIWRRSQ